LQRHHLQLDIHSYCRRQIVKGVGCETEKQTALTDSRIADQEHLQEMIELPSRLLPPSLFAQTSNAYTFGSLFSFLFFFLCFFFFTENQKLSTNTSPSSSPRIKSFPQILLLLLLLHQESKAFHKSLVFNSWIPAQFSSDCFLDERYLLQPIFFFFKRQQ
jgi:hypothetical protein